MTAVAQVSRIDGPPRHTDLAAEAEGLEVEVYIVTIWPDPVGNPTQYYPERAEAVFFPATHRLGLAWGAPAAYCDCAGDSDIEQAIADWLGDDEDAWLDRDGS